MKRRRENELTTKQAAGLLGVSSATIKRWADAGALPVVRTIGGHRRFARNAVEALQDTAPPETGLESDRWVRQLVECDEGLALDGALLTERSKADGWYAVAETLGAVLDELGRRWEQGTLSVADEHIASARLSRAIARAVATLPTRNGAPRALLATPEGEAHTLGLALAELCIREWGWATTWIGRGTPTPDLERLVASGRGAALILSASVHGDAARIADVAQRLGAACGSARVGLVMGGRGSWPDPPPFGRVLRSFRELRVWMARFDQGLLV